MEWILSSKGKKKLSYKGYIYVFLKDLADSVKSYECALRRNHDCKAKVKAKILNNKKLWHFEAPFR